jgi:hypothetical protein
MPSFSLSIMEISQQTFVFESGLFVRSEFIYEYMTTYNSLRDKKKGMANKTCLSSNKFTKVRNWEVMLEFHVADIESST